MSPEALAALHARCFTLPPPWPATAFAAMLDMPGVFLLTEGRDAFLLGRALAGEAELLTLAVAPEARRGGVGRRLTAAFAGRAARMGADQAFLEVACDNLAARALYSAQGWLEAGRRRRYYGPATDAIVMRLTLRVIQEGG
ncbi:GNAT family N-acetyltransferase [Paracoccus aestuarii]|uniref:GNAT family N-acetyltransferase n=1 Tax=Paracoccus aestuarii TaxID=453842 RepID=A0A418ZQ79_9RHOB|nr:GNAT family N-acetyltransferase [Paracoccus aestuarii]RJK97379.1 GNAT family N-acetyltransferase [Paracoccus aestuarii]WCQ99765.1 GNAT family N-acetyltransferase [Paracoccus aestuarii]